MREVNSIFIGRKIDTKLGTNNRANPYPQSRQSETS